MAWWGWFVLALFYLCPHLEDYIGQGLKSPVSSFTHICGGRYWILAGGFLTRWLCSKALGERQQGMQCCSVGLGSHKTCLVFK